MAFMTCFDSKPCVAKSHQKQQERLQSYQGSQPSDQALQQTILSPVSSGSKADLASGADSFPPSSTPTAQQFNQVVSRVAVAPRGSAQDVDELPVGALQRLPPLGPIGLP